MAEWTETSRKFGSIDLRSSMTSLSSSFSSSTSSSRSTSSSIQQDIRYKICPTQFRFISGADGQMISERNILDLGIDKWKLGYAVDHKQEYKNLFLLLREIQNSELQADRENYDILIAVTTYELDHQSWIQNITNCINAYLGEHIGEETLDFSPKGQDWISFATRKLHFLSENAKSRGCPVNMYIANGTEIHMVGSKDTLCQFMKKNIDDIRGDSVSSHTVEMNIHDQKLFELGIEKEIRRDCPLVDIRHDVGAHMIEIEGLTKDVYNARGLFDELIKTHIFVIKKLNSRKANFLRGKRSARRYISRSVEEKNWKWGLEGEDIQVFGPIDSNVNADEVVSLLIEEAIDLSEIESDIFFTSTQWKKEKRQIQRDHEAYLKLEEDLGNGKLFVVCTANVIDAVKDKLQKFREIRRVTHTQTYDEMSEFRYRNRTKELFELRTEEFVECCQQYNQLQFEGTQRGIEKIQSIFSTQLIHDSEHILTVKVTEKGAMRYLQSKRGSELLGDVKAGNNFVIRLKQAPEIVLVMENIEDQKTSTILNSVSPDLNLNVGQPKIAMSIFTKGGKEFQKKLFEAYPNGINYNDMVISKAAGELKCQWVFNCCLESHKTNKKTKEDLAKMIHKCLQGTKENPERYTSIAIPALGTGVHRYPAELAAKTTFDAIVSFCSANVDFGLETIRVVVFPNTSPQVKQQFSEEYKRRVKSGHPIVELNEDNIAVGYITIVSSSQDTIQATIKAIHQRLGNRKRHDFAKTEDN